MKEKAGSGEVMVVERRVLLEERAFQGFSSAGSFDYEKVILNHYRYAQRGEAEEEPSLKQPIAYCMIVNPGGRLIFTYRRAEGEGAYDEKRLRGKWSIGIGGHIDPGDLDRENPIRASMMRELEEEIALEGAGEPRIIGYLNDESDMVGRVHFGLLYCLETPARAIEPRTEEIAEARMIALEECEEMMNDRGIIFEEWSRIAWPPLRRELERGLL